MVEHTPTPWIVVSKPDFHNGLTYTSIQPVTPDVVTMRPLLMASGEHHVCRMTHTAARHAIDLHQANAALIVRAVNRDHHFDALVQALELIASGTKDWEYPFRAMPESEMRKIAREALHGVVGSPAGSGS